MAHCSYIIAVLLIAVVQYGTPTAITPSPKLNTENGNLDIAVAEGKDVYLKVGARSLKATDIMDQMENNGVYTVDNDDAVVSVDAGKSIKFQQGSQVTILADLLSDLTNVITDVNGLKNSTLVDNALESLTEDLGVTDARSLFNYRNIEILHKNVSDIREMVGNLETSKADASVLADKADATALGNLVTLVDNSLNCQANGQALDKDTDTCKNFEGTRAYELPDNACDLAGKGLIRMKGDVLELCSGTKWAPVFEAPLGERYNPASSCQAILDQRPESMSGVYYLDKTSVVSQRYCKIEGTTATDMGGDGTTRANAAASCEIVTAFNPAGTWAFLYPSGTIESDDANAARGYCSKGTRLTWDGSSANTPATSCKDLVMPHPLPGFNAGGDYFIQGASAILTQQCDASGFGLGGDGSSAALASHGTCRTLRDAYNGLPSGPYYIAPGGLQPFQVYCDMSGLGGGWTFISQVGTGVPNTNGEVYPVRGDNPELLLEGPVEDSSRWSSLTREQINAIFAVYDDTILRSYTRYSVNSDNPETYFVLKLAQNNNFDVFHGIRNTHPDVWGTWNTASGYRVYRGDGNYQSQTHSFTGGASSAAMQYWELHTVTGNDGFTYDVSRHGITGDAFGGCEWLFHFGIDGDTYSHCKNENWSHLYLK